jgi:hypothetical protein
MGVHLRCLIQACNCPCGQGNTNYIDRFSMWWYTLKTVVGAYTCLLYRDLFRPRHTYQRHPSKPHLQLLESKVENNTRSACSRCLRSVCIDIEKNTFGTRDYSGSLERQHTQVHSHQNRHRRPEHSRYHYKLADSRKIWERVMGTTHPSPQGYKETCVLLLGWTEECDDTGTASEVSLNRKKKQAMRLYKTN